MFLRPLRENLRIEDEPHKSEVMSLIAALQRLTQRQIFPLWGSSQKAKLSIGLANGKAVNYKGGKVNIDSVCAFKYPNLLYVSLQIPIFPWLRFFMA